eukprot:6185926-Pleurochrysis_carterae.AAC.1
MRHVRHDLNDVGLICNLGPRLAQAKSHIQRSLGRRVLTLKDCGGGGGGRGKSSRHGPPQPCMLPAGSGIGFRPVYSLRFSMRSIGRVGRCCYVSPFLRIISEVCVYVCARAAL